MWICPPALMSAQRAVRQYNNDEGADNDPGNADNLMIYEMTVPRHVLRQSCQPTPTPFGSAPSEASGTSNMLAGGAGFCAIHQNNDAFCAGHDGITDVHGKR